MDTVILADLAGNRIRKHVGYSLFYTFFGPLYMLFNLRFEFILVLILYYWILPIPGLTELGNAIVNTGWDPRFISFLNGIFLFFRQGWTSFSTYFGLILFVILHISLSFKADNYILKHKIRKKKLSPYLEDDARKLIYYHIAPKDVLIYSDMAQKEHLHDQAEKIWEDNNLSYTMMLSKRELDKSKTMTEFNSLDEAKRATDLSLLKRGLITNEEFEKISKTSASSNKIKGKKAKK